MKRLILLFLFIPTLLVAQFVITPNTVPLPTTGSGSYVLSTSPTLVTPTLGVATATSYSLTSKLAFSSTAPTISAGLCTSPAVTNNNGTAGFTVTVGTSCTGVTTGTITLPAATIGWMCSIINLTTPATQNPDQTGGTTTTAVFTNYSRTLGTALDWTAGEVLRISCVAM